MRFVVTIALFLLCSWSASSQPDSIRIAFYNCENYFDSFRDSTINDEDYTSQGKRYWSYSRFLKKRNSIFKVFASMSNPTPPEIIGLCEIENRFVLNQLAYETPLSRFGYAVVHENSSDRRGIDVALIYQKDRLRLLAYKYFNPRSIDSSLYTRSILYAKFRWGDFDTLHVLVNHFPSKLGGERSDRSRLQVGHLLKAKIDSIQSVMPTAHIVAMGDFNDTPESDALALLSNGSLVNLAIPLAKEGIGSIRFEGKWELIDQLIVSKSLASGDSPITLNGRMRIYAAPFLLTADEEYGGEKPLRTFNGFSYIGGYSDHLPIFISLVRAL